MVRHCALSLALVLAGAYGARGDFTLNKPQGVCYDRQGRLYIADTGNRRVVVVAPSLKVLRILGGRGAAADLGEPMDVAVDSTDRIVVADGKQHCVHILAPDGTLLARFGKQGRADGEFATPCNVSVDDHNNIIVSDRWNHRLQSFDRHGRHLCTFSNETGPKSAAQIAEERRWAVAEGKDPDDVKVDQPWANTDVGQFNEPGGTYYDPALKRLFVANGWNCRIEMLDYDPDSGRMARRGPIDGIAWGFWLTRSLAGDERGGLVGCDTNFGLIHRFADRAAMNNKTKPARTEGGGAYGDLRGLTDIAVNAAGDIAAVDSENGRIVIFDKDFTRPQSPRVSGLGRDRVTIAWSTRAAGPSDVLLRQGTACERTPGHERPWSEPSVRSQRVLDKVRSTRSHRVTLSGLQPGKRYFYKLRVPDARTIPGGGWSREYAVATLAPKGRASYVAIPVRLLIAADVIQVESLRPGAPWPAPTSDADIGLYRAAIEEAVRFYWVNSRMRYYTDIDVLVDRRMVRSGRFPAVRKPAAAQGQWEIDAGRNFGLAPGMRGTLAQFRDGKAAVVAQAEVVAADQETARVAVSAASAQVREGLVFTFDPRYLELPEMNHDAAFQRVAAGRKLPPRVYSGQVVVECERRWNAGRGEWAYTGSGGGTYGVEWPIPGRSHFLGGSDIAWLMCHEFKHQIESQYNNSGLDREDDRMWFCHFSPRYDNPDPAVGKWQWDTAADHGEHWDGIAWQMRRMTAAQWMRNLYGEVRLAQDRDEDGIPDDDPRLPLDERRFGSSPNRADTDGDGLSDMAEALASTWVTALNTDMRKRTGRAYLRPNPRSPDSDRDGIRDGVDPYPLHPFRPAIARGSALVDGTLGEWPVAKPWLWMDSHGVALRGWSRHDDNWLYLAFRISGPWQRLSIVTDNNADGFYCGNDNVYVRIAADAAGPKLLSARAHLCNMNRWPYFDDKQERFRQSDMRFAGGAAGGAQIVELALPRDPRMGLDVRKGEKVGLMVYIGLPDGPTLSLFEPWAIFDSVME